VRDAVRKAGTKLDVSRSWDGRGNAKTALDAKREGTMHEMTSGARTVTAARRSIPIWEPVEAARTEKGRSLVVDLSGTRHLDLPNLALLLTAQQLAEQEDRDTWLAGIALPLWHALQAMGLGRLFRSLPASGAVSA
jgi:anti-anti-sigma regulatory factor